MKEVIVDLKDMSDSKEFLNAKPNAFFGVFIYILIAAVIVALIWAYNSEIETYIKAPGIVRPKNDVSTVKSQVMGKVEKVYVTDGDYVKKGDPLITIDKETATLGLAKINTEIEMVSNETRNLTKQKESILTQTNLFDRNKPDEELYYYAVEKYFKDNDYIIKQTSDEVYDTNSNIKLLSEQIEQSNKNLSKYYKDLENAKLFKDSVMQETNLFTNNDLEYHINMETYLKNVSDMQKNIDIATNEYNKQYTLFVAGAVSKKELEDSENIKLNYEDELTKYKLSQISMADSKIANLESQEEGLIGNKINLETQYSIYGGKTIDSSIELEQMKLSNVSQIESVIKANEEKLKALEIQKQELEINLSKSEIKAEQDGVVSVYSKISEGDFIDTSGTLMSILPIDSNTFKLNIEVSNKDISSIYVGQEVKVKFLALPYQDYGVVKSTVSKISPDIKFDSNTGQYYYLVESILENKPITSYSGEEKDILVGMACEANFLETKTSVLNWILDKMNIIDLKL